MNVANALQQEKAKVLAMSVLPQVVLLWDANKRCTAWNKASALNYLGLEPEFIQGQQLEDLPIAASKKATLLKYFVTVAQSRQAETFVAETTYEGRSYVLYVTVSPVLNEEGQWVGWLMQSLPPATEMPLLEFHWQSIYAKSTEHYMWLSPSGEITAVNHSFQGKSIELWLNHDFREVLHDSEKEVFTSALARTVTSAELTRFEIPVETRWYAITLSPWVASNRQTVLAVIMRLEDVTDVHQQRIEEEGRITLLNDALSGAEEAVALIHASGRFIFRNTAFREIVSGVPLNLQDLHHLLKGRLYRTDGETPLEISELSVFAEEMNERSKQRFCISNDEKQVKVLESTYQPLLKERGESYYYLWTLRDISRDERQIRLLLEEKQEMNHILRATSHDMRSAVSNIQNLSQLMKRNKEPEAVRALSDRLNDSSKALFEVFEGMLELARSRAENGDQYETILLKQLLNEVRLMLPAQLINERTVFEEALEVESIEFNKAYLRSILFNLLVNALKYADEAKPDVIISIKTLHATNGMWLIIADNGIGMDMEVVKNDLFKPFKRFTQQSTGSGVGLSLVKHFVEKNGGEIHVESKKGVGTTFKLLLRSYDPEQKQYELF